MSALVLRGIVSGGQTGVDRAALDVARELGIPHGGWCPAGRKAEDGPLASHYTLRETFLSDPRQRTTWNVYDSDATLIVSPAALEGGTAATLEQPERFSRPHLAVAPRQSQLARTREWLRSVPGPVLLNVAGPRESESPGAYAAARGFLVDLLAPIPDFRIETAPPTRVLVTGGSGLLGGRLVRLAPPGIEVHSTYRSHRPALGPTHAVELSDAGVVDSLLTQLRPGLVIHTAYTMTDGERDIWKATHNVAAGAAGVGAHLIHMSSDVVFDGNNAPYAESAEPNPIYEYGRWKAKAESHVRGSDPSATVVRSSLITRFDPPDPRSTALAASLREGTPVTLFVDEIRSPILVDDLARQIWEIARLEPGRRAGVWHLAGPESLSRYGLGLLAAAALGLDGRQIVPRHSRFAAPPRPLDLRLSMGRADRELPTRSRPISEAAARAAGKAA